MPKLQVPIKSQQRPISPLATKGLTTVISLASSVSVIPKIGPAVSLKLQKLGIETVRDLLFYWPRTWLDATTPLPITAVRQDQLVVVDGKLSALQYDPPIARRRPKITAMLTDASGDSLPVVWHNQAYLRRTLQNGQRWVFIGKTVWNWQQRHLELSNPQRVTERAVLAIYPETAGITSAFLRSLIQPLLEHSVADGIGSVVVDPLMMPLAQAIQTMHRPVRLVDVTRARHRLALDELVMVQYRLWQQRAAVQHRSPVIRPAVVRLQDLVAKLPFTLTDEQRRVSWTIIQQLASDEPLRHVLQGDVGTGKTIVALLVAISVLESGYDVCWMAPTQLLARQLRDRLAQLCATQPFDVALVTSTEKPGLRTRPTLYVGTQALLRYFTDSVSSPALVIIDEQHRFGVKQQESLTAHACHVLSMTATPIPRALLLALYGERGSSQLKERPIQQLPVTTTALPVNARGPAILSLQSAVARGEQGFIVTPRIEAGEDSLGSFPSLQAVLLKYQRALPDIRFAAYHGNLTDTQQQQTMDDFLNRRIDVLVATSIIEVGLDVQNATQMLIEQADWFGLAQLHQLRGRVGRGDQPGACFVFQSESGATDRLQAFCKISNGFELAAMDLRFRGPGDLLGALQSGWGRLRLADPTDTALADEARAVVGQLSQSPPAALADWLALYVDRGSEELHA